MDLLSLLALLQLPLVTLAQNSANLRGQTGSFEQVLVFDAGSSGTRIHIFNMHMPARGAQVPTIDLSVRDTQTLKVKPGLSHFARHDDLEGCKQNIMKLIEFANKFVDEGRRPQTPVVLKATAGLRAVAEAKANAVLSTVRETLRGSTYKCQDEWVDIIKGKEEAGLAWVAANYLRGTFDGLGTSPSNSIGVIEMGGGSTQVSFEVDPSESQRLIDSDKFVFTTAVQRQYFVYAHSYLGYGQDYAQDKLKKLLDADGATDPCYPKGHSRKNSPGRVVNGTGDAASCKNKIQSLVLMEQQAPGHYEHELPLRGSMVATENFFYVRNNLGLPQKEAVRPTDAEAQATCSAPWPPALESGCFGLSYQVSLLGALKASGDTVKVQRKINGGDIDWAIGAALVHLLDGRASGTNLGIQGGITFAVVILASLSLAFLTFFRFRQNSRKCKKRMDPVLFGSKAGALE